jgi:hypothetical protein
VSGADPSSVPRNVSQGQRFGRVPAGLLVVVHAFGRERLGTALRYGPDSPHVDTRRSNLEGVRSRGAETPNLFAKHC